VRAALLMLLIFIGMSDADSNDDYVAYQNPTTLEKKELTFNMEQNVSGTGFYAAYRYAQMPEVLGVEGSSYNGVEAKNRAHVSGQIDIDSLMYAHSSYTNRTWIDGAFDDNGDFVEEEEEATSAIRMNDDGIMSYHPAAMTVGVRYYAAHPIGFNSMINDNIWIKNRDGLNSINRRIDDARGLDMLRSVESDAVTASMKIIEDMVDGKAHIGAIQLAGIPLDEEPEEEEAMEGDSDDGSGEDEADDGSEEGESADDETEEMVLGAAMKARHDPIFELDQNYMGSYHMVTELTLNVIEEEEEEEEDQWLPCCSGGFLGLYPADRAKRSVHGVFDCTCFRRPKA